jgi:hypothetical protein
LALKKFINSVYGATASKYFIAHNVDVAESITLQGQDLNHYSENAVNEYFSGVFQNDTELHKKLGISTEDAQKVSIAKGKTTETGLLEGPDFWYLKGNQSLTVAGDTDSVTGDTVIDINGKRLTIEQFFKECKEENDLPFVLKTEDSKEIVPVYDKQALTYIDHNDCATYKPVHYVFRHKVKKAKFRIKSESDKEIIVTGDHSIMVIRDNTMMSIPAKNIKPTDRLITVE